MANTQTSTAPVTKAVRFILYVGAVLTVVMILFPPFTSLNGTEYAFFLTGPEWSRAAGELGSNLGLTAHIHWALLLMQLAVVWALALGARYFLKSESPTPRNPALLLGCFFLFLLTPLSANGQTSTDQPAAGTPGGRFSVGFASSWPAYGISGTMQVNEKVTAEAVVGFLGAVTNLSGRGWYRFNRKPSYDLYGYGAVGVYRYGYSALGASDTESVLGLGGGVGIEASLGKLLKDEDFPPIYVNTELGLAFANFEHYNFSSFIWGAGVHYRFGGH
ncbi:MAG TPA: hypothetical protein VFG50_06095 [Rhodothermales bacterium]|nr:hypothetical protein [Rhodothermales bacterium]